MLETWTALVRNTNHSLKTKSGAIAPRGDIMSIKIKYAIKRHNTWVYRRTYPKYLQGHLGSSMKQSLKTADANTAKARVAELDQTFRSIIKEAEAYVSANTGKVSANTPTITGTVFHSKRKWFITQCERTGVPEHYMATIVGHQSARSSNKLTHALYLGGVIDT